MPRTFALATLLLPALSLAAPNVGPTAFRALQPGVEYGRFVLTDAPTHGDGLLHVVRIDPVQAPLVLRLASRDGPSRTAAEWSRDEKLAVVINAGMFEQDFVTHTGLLRDGAHVQQPRWVKAYQSLLVIGPTAPGLPAATILDATPEGRADPRLASYRTVLQNLRLVRGEGVNTWKQQPKRWSEAAIAADRQGRILFVFTRTPLTMHDFNTRLVALPLDVIRAQHAEGGPESSLSIHAGGVDLDLAGSYETGFTEDDTNAEQWPLPNVLGVARPAPR